MDDAMSPTQSTDREALDRLLEEGRRRGYVKRAELEAIFRRLTAEGAPATGDAPAAGETSAPEIEELYDLDAAVEQLLAADVDIVDDDEEEARVRRVEAVAEEAERGEAAEVDAITAYLREIGRVPMLSHAQEIDLAKGIEAGDKEGGQQFEAIGQVNLLGVAEHRDAPNLAQIG